MFFWAKPADSNQWEEIPANGGLLIAGIYNIAIQSPQPHFTVVSHLRQYRRRKDGTEELYWQTEQPSRTNDEGVGWIAQDIELTEGRWQISCRDADLVAELFGESPSNSISFQVIDLKGARLSSGPQSSFSVSLPEMSASTTIAETQPTSQPVEISAQTVVPEPTQRDRSLYPGITAENASPVPEAEDTTPNHSDSSVTAYPLDPIDTSAEGLNGMHLSNSTDIEIGHSNASASAQSALTHSPHNHQSTAREPSSNPDDAVTEIFTPPESAKEEFVLSHSEFTAIPGEILHITGHTKISGQLSVTALAKNSLLIQEVQRLQVPSRAPFLSFSVQLSVPDDWSEDAIVGVAELHPEDGSVSLSQDFTVTAEPRIQLEDSTWNNALVSVDNFPSTDLSLLDHPSLQTKTPTQTTKVTAAPRKPEPPPWSPDLAEEEILPPEIAFASSRTPDRTLLKLLALVQSSAAASAARTRYQQSQSVQAAPNEAIIDGIVGDVSVISNPIPANSDAPQPNVDRIAPFKTNASALWGSHHPAKRNSGHNTAEASLSEVSTPQSTPEMEDCTPAIEPVLQSADEIGTTLSEPIVTIADGASDSNPALPAKAVASTNATSSKSSSTSSANISIDIPKSLRSGDLVSVVMKSKADPHPACVKLWVINSANQTVVDGPRWILDLSADGDIHTGITHLTIPSRVQSLQFQACAYSRLPSNIEDHSDSVAPVATVTVHRAVSPR